MKRFVPHMAITLLGIFCLAMIWRFEPPIVMLKKPPRAHPNAAETNRDFFVRLETGSGVELTELTVTITWDRRKIVAPRVWRGARARGFRPHVEMKPGHMTLTLKRAPGGNAGLLGPGRLARLGFRQTDRRQPADLSALRIVSAEGLTADGRRVPFEDLSLVRYEPRTKRRLAGPSLPRDGEIGI